MKKKVILTIMVALSVAIAGCGSKGETTENQKEVTVKDTDSKKVEKQEEDSEKDTKKSEKMNSQKEETTVKEDEKASSQQTVSTDNNSSDTNSFSNSNAVENGDSNSASGGYTGHTNNGSSSGNSTTTPVPTLTSEPVHTHTWVHIDATGHYETVTIQAAWDETVPIYENVAHDICNDCGADLTNLSEDDLWNHIFEHADNGGKGSFSTKWFYEQTGTQTIHHDAVTENRWIEDTPAYDVCSGCGFTK